ncbi:MAG TPA: hypothetical protein VGN44_12750 [Candidatus Angelobacter sp.]
MFTKVPGASCNLACSVPLLPLDTTTVPVAEISSSQTAGNAHGAIVEFSCDFPRVRHESDGISQRPSSPDEKPE